MREFILELSPKQKEAFTYLRDHKTTELFYGGGAGGGKSWLGCVWLTFCCIAYPGTRYLMGRARLKSLKESTLLTLFNVFKEWDLKRDKDWKYNAIEGVVSFTNGSAIYLKDLFLYPTDPEFDSLGSTEFTGAFMDEVSEITEKAKNIVMSRLRYKLDQYNLVPKLLMASNPSKNFAYREYWKPWSEGKLLEYRQFVPALVGDNPFVSKYYAQNLKKLDKNSKERLLYGNWNYDDDPSRLFDFDKINEVFTNDFVEHSKYAYISADIARFGRDNTVICVWKGLRIIKIRMLPKSSTKECRIAIEDLAREFGVPRSHIVIDEDGIGGGVVDELPGVKGFVNNSRPLEFMQVKRGQLVLHNFANLKTQCYFKLADYVNENKIYCEVENIEIKEKLSLELEQIKVKDIDKDGKVSLIPKEIIKESLGGSPDLADAIMMRMIFEVSPTYKPQIA